MVVQPDGKIVTLGTTGATSTSLGLGGELMLVRYHANGRLDTSFGEDGIALIPGHGIAVGRDPGSLALVDGNSSCSAPPPPTWPSTTCSHCWRG
ncbi:delta-60 repeat domain-containing protein [Massilia puerhi]|uniref:delta-60 repeat domain-containing protein n=1 Tax=Massilia puerhi TaxID=2681550 RepID=UPI001359BB86|nr:delta-60 repeat domain-containing protein [Massilia puerhi]